MEEVDILATKDVHSSSIPIKKDFNAGNRKKIRSVYQDRTYYLFLTIILILCLILFTRGIYINIARYVTLKHQLHQLKVINASATSKNNELKEQLLKFSSGKGVEALARDNFKMVGKDEVLVVIKKPAAKK